MVVTGGSAAGITIGKMGVIEVMLGSEEVEADTLTEPAE